MQKPNLERLFRPQSIAIVGASASPEKAGYMALKLLENYSGKVYPVNPNAETILGRRVFSSLSAIGEPVDLVILAVPASLCPDLLRASAAINAGAALILGGGFGESGEEGLQIQNELVEICRRTGIRLLGPNTGGFADPINQLVASFSVSFRKLKPGSIAVVSQSGGISLILGCMLENDGFGISLTVGLGNSVDVDAADVIDYLVEDENTRVIALYLEGLSDGRRFYKSLNRATAHKPVVALTIGRNEIGAFARSHTGNLVGSYALKVAAFKQAGAVPVENTNDLVDAAAALSMMRLDPKPAPGVGMLVGQAGAGLLMLDQLKSLQVNVPELGEQCIAKIAEHLPPMYYISNPVDVGRRTEAEFTHIMRVLDQEDTLDALLLYGLYEPTALDPVKLFKELDPPLAKPVIFGTAGETADMRAVCREIQAMGVVPFKSPERSARAMHAVVCDAQYQYRKSRYAGERFTPLKKPDLPSGSLDEAQAKQVLQTMNIPVPKSIACHSHEQAHAAFTSLNKPVIAKVLHAEIQHKTEVGGVHPDIKDPEQLSLALHRIDRINHHGEHGYLIEEMAAPGLDLIIGGLRDPIFGPSVLLGLGGTMAEALKDVSMRLAPLHQADAEEMLNELKARTLFDGWRGSPPVDRQAVVDTLLAVAALITQDERIKELDINPLRATDHGVLALDALIVQQ